MENFEIDKIKERYKELKIQNYEKENELRTLIRAKEKFPNIAKDEKWINSYRTLLSEISEEMDCFKKIKVAVSPEELNEFSYEIKSEIFKKIYYENNLDRFELQKENISAGEYNVQNTSYLYNNLEPVVQNKLNIDRSNFAQTILEEKNFLKKVDLVAFLAKKDNNFFDTSVIYRGEITKLFLNKMNLEGIDQNEVITAALIYTCKKIDSAQEIDRIKNEKDKDFDYLSSLGFSSRFCKMCTEHSRYNQPEGDYIREPEGDILELVENYVGLTMHREDRMAFPIDEALDLIEHKNLQGKDNRYLEDFKNFVKIMDEIKINNIDAPDTILHKLTTCYNSIPRSDVREAVRRTGDVHESISANGIIVEPECSRNDIKKEVFEKMTYIETVIDISMLSKYLGYKCLQLTESRQQAKNYYDEAIKANTNEEIVSDMIK